MSTTPRRPTGKPPWPSILIAGSDKSGKSLEIALLSAERDLVGIVHWITFGERSADEYAQVPNSNFLIWEPDDRAELLQVVREVTQLPREVEGLPNVVAFDGGTALWELLSREAQDKANERAAAKAARPNSRATFDANKDYDIGRDLWNEAADRWDAVITPLIRYKDLVIITTRLDEVSATDDRGQPVAGGLKEWSIKAQKRLPGYVDAIVQFRGWYPGKRFITGIRSYAMSQLVDRVDERPKDYSIRDLLTEMGVTLETAEAREGAGPPRPESRMADGWLEELDALDRADDVDGITELWHVANKRGNEAAKTLIAAVGHNVRARLSALADGKEPPPRVPILDHQDAGQAGGDVPAQQPEPTTGAEGVVGETGEPAAAGGAPNGEPLQTQPPATTENDVHETTSTVVKEVGDQDAVADEHPAAEQAAAPVEPTEQQPPTTEPAQLTLAEETAARTDWNEKEKKARGGWRERLAKAVAGNQEKAIDALIRQATTMQWWDLLELVDTALSEHQAQMEQQEATTTRG